ncbi:unnamed protein product [Toxocara canis]|uniref:Post-SET domain-containing protein n=1 Tax=Toxocara canis TaxID=6265 RepID=A0A183TVE1_TOXCA|nr:unnamed protein product [Toxocara canis]
MSLEFGCSDGVHSDICVTTVSLKEVQSVSCYCSTNACNGPASLMKYFVVSRHKRRAVTRDERISTVVNSILNQIETIVNKFKNDTDPLVQYVVGSFQDNQEKLKQQVNELLPSLS